MTNDPNSWNGPGANVPAWWRQRRGRDLLLIALAYVEEPPHASPDRARYDRLKAFVLGGIADPIPAEFESAAYVERGMPPAEEADANARWQSRAVVGVAYWLREGDHDEAGLILCGSRSSAALIALLRRAASDPSQPFRDLTSQRREVIDGVDAGARARFFAWSDVAAKTRRRVERRVARLDWEDTMRARRAMRAVADAVRAAVGRTAGSKSNIGSISDE